MRSDQIDAKDWRREVRKAANAKHEDRLWFALNETIPDWRWHRQHKFCTTRRWKFDLANLMIKLAIEIHGQTWANGRHNRGYGMQQDFEKHNAAVLAGWRVLYFSGDDVQKRMPYVIEIIVAALNQRKEA